MGCAVVLSHLRVAPIEARIVNSDCVIYIFPCISCQLISEESRNNLELVSIVINLSFFLRNKHKNKHYSLWDYLVYFLSKFRVCWVP